MDTTTLSHFEFVREIALSLFESTLPLHGLGNSSRIVLETAATFDLQPLHQKIKGSRRIARELVSTLPDQVNPELNLKVLEAVLAFQHSDFKKKSVKKFDLSPIEQREALTLAALLRIAVGLNASNSQTSNLQQIEISKGVIWIVIGGPHAIQDALAAGQSARLWAQIGYPKMRLLEAVEARTKIMPYPEPGKLVGITADDPLSEAGRKVMRFHFAQMLKHEPGTRLGEDIEALHDMRVATRRMRAAFMVFNDAFKAGALKTHLAGLRATGRALGKTRDLDVMLQNARRFLGTLPEDQHEGFHALLSDWEAQREAARVEMITFLDSADYHNFKRKFNVFLNTPGASVLPLSLNPPTPSKVCELAPVLIYKQLAAVRAYETIMASASTEQLHALRIEFKRLRYTVEYFREVLDEDGNIVIDMIKTIQDHLGELNDAQVAAQMIEEYLARTSQTDEVVDLNDQRATHAYLVYQIEAGNRLKEGFAEVWAAFNRPHFRGQIARSLANL